MNFYAGKMLHFRQELGNKIDEYAVEIYSDDTEKANISARKLKFVSLTTTSLSCIVTGKKANKGTSNQIKVAVECFENRRGKILSTNAKLVSQNTVLKTSKCSYFTFLKV